MTRSDALAGPARRRRVLRALLLVAAAVALSGIGYSSARAASEEKAARAEAAPEAPTVVTPSARSRRVIACYFHTTYRCASCRAIEAYSHEAIESAFADELKDGRLLWKAVNIEVKGNEHFAKDYKLYTKALVLVEELRGRPARWKNLEKVWQLLQDKPRFLRYVREETRAYLRPRT
jgi:hypothetical protein